MNRHRHIESDPATFTAEAYALRRHPGVAWRVLGWQTAPDDDTEWTGLEERTGQVACVMVGDDHRWFVDPDDLEPLDRAAYCGACGQRGCTHDGYDRTEAE
jgi:hypothetical protein